MQARFVEKLWKYKKKKNKIRGKKHSASGRYMRSNGSGKY